MNRCAIIGASGHGKVVAELVELNGYQEIVFFDDRWPELTHVEHWPVEGDLETLLTTVSSFDLTVIAIGNNKVRLEKHKMLSLAGAKFSVLVHPNATISKHSQVGVGTVVMANAVINSFVSIGEACIINTASTIDHDCHLADGVHISPGCNLAGGVTVGEGTWLGIGSQIKQLISIGSGVIVGAGATVINHVSDLQTVVGTPAQVVKKSK
ncbi:acetyltransferase [Shewanella algae]|uniref:acetyltransferase n=1 Tax=Shewanella algae TaxID=38313 RepID=UPI001AAF939E|nr:acetyltransferase [Shewanella algae]MBO2581714.1 acetyltransferase [Shewanella algae]